MSPSPLRRVRVRALFVFSVRNHAFLIASVCAGLLSLGSVWADRQQPATPVRTSSPPWRHLIRLQSPRPRLRSL